MGHHDADESRRRFLLLTGGASLFGVAGCLGGEGDQESHDGGDEIDLSAEVPESDRTCTSIDGLERDPDDLRSKEEAAYQHAPQGYQLCANCRFFCPGTTDEVGACTEVAGRIRSQHWCALYAPTDRLAERPPSEIDWGND